MRIESRKPRSVDHVAIELAVAVAQRLALRRQVGDDEISRARRVGCLAAVRARLHYLALGRLARGDVADLLDPYRADAHLLADALKIRGRQHRIGLDAMAFRTAGDNLEHERL